MKHSTSFVHNNDNEMIICLHSGFSTTRVWSNLMSRLSANHSVTATVSSYNAYAEQIHSDNANLLENQASQITEAIARQNSKVHLIAHSFGAAVALRIAQNRPENLASLVLMEPLANHLLRQSDPDDNQRYREICEISADLSGAVRRGDYWSGMNQLVNEWSGKNIWYQFDAHRKLELVNAFERIPVELLASMNNKSTIADLNHVKVPTLILCGTGSPEPFRRMSCLLNEAIETAHLLTIADAGHLQLLTHQFEIAKHIHQHFDRLATPKMFGIDDSESLIKQQVV